MSLKDMTKMVEILDRVAAIKGREDTREADLAHAKYILSHTAHSDPPTPDQAAEEQRLGISRLPMPGCYITENASSGLALKRSQEAMRSKLEVNFKINTDFDAIEKRVYEQVEKGTIDAPVEYKDMKELEEKMGSTTAAAPTPATEAKVLKYTGIMLDDLRSKAISSSEEEEPWDPKSRIHALRYVIAVFRANEEQKRHVNLGEKGIHCVATWLEELLHIRTGGEG